eukprot:TRINITY_DN70050_c0_g1_i1.p3 TRINITY_DN70050_c0_g1~~TRINITY_DN70050_c0_g1_i1.p3  ORF type:complete len:111 (+),score=13.02 TRINITY_DN70050_c0_g1_i1:598-930(+)
MTCISRASALRDQTGSHRGLCGSGHSQSDCSYQRNDQVQVVAMRHRQVVAMHHRQDVAMRWCGPTEAPHSVDGDPVIDWHFEQICDYKNYKENPSVATYHMPRTSLWFAC